MTKKTIALHGASGSQGAPLAAALRAAGHAVRPVTRAAGADLLDRDSLVAAYAGADAVVVQLPIAYDERALAMGDNAARAAELAGVRHVVVNTSGPIPPEPVGVPFVDARHRAAAARVELVTVVQPGTYLENLSAPWSAGAVGAGAIPYPVPAAAPLPWVATADVAGAIATAIERETAGTFALAGPPRTGDEVAAAIGAALGRPVRWEPIEPEAYAALLRPYLGAHAADGTAAVYRSMLDGPPPPAAADPVPAHEALGFAPRSVEAWAREVAWPLARAA